MESASGLLYIPGMGPVYPPLKKGKGAARVEGDDEEASTGRKGDDPVAEDSVDLPADTTKGREATRKRNALYHRCIRTAMLRGQPTLAVCGGHYALWRSLHVRCGFQDAARHSNRGGMPRLGKGSEPVVNNRVMHRVQVLPGTHLACGMMDRTRMALACLPAVNSVHSWAIHKPSDGSGFEVVNICYSATSTEDIHMYTNHDKGTKERPEEGCVEAIETVFGAPVIGVQWHPEAFFSGPSQPTEMQQEGAGAPSSAGDADMSSGAAEGSEVDIDQVREEARVRSAPFHQRLIQYMTLAGAAYAARRKMTAQFHQLLNSNKAALESHAQELKQKDASTRIAVPPHARIRKDEDYHADYHSGSVAKLMPKAAQQDAHRFEALDRATAGMSAMSVAPDTAALSASQAALASHGSPSRARDHAPSSTAAAHAWPQHTPMAPLLHTLQQATTMLSALHGGSAGARPGDGTSSAQGLLPPSAITDLEAVSDFIAQLQETLSNIKQQYGLPGSYASVVRYRQPPFRMAGGAQSVAGRTQTTGTIGHFTDAHTVYDGEGEELDVFADKQTDKAATKDLFGPVPLSKYTVANLRSFVRYLVSGPQQHHALSSAAACDTDASASAMPQPLSSGPTVFAAIARSVSRSILPRLALAKEWKKKYEADRAEIAKRLPNTAVFFDSHLQQAVPAYATLQDLAHRHAEWSRKRDMLCWILGRLHGPSELRLSTSAQGILRPLWDHLTSLFPHECWSWWEECTLAAPKGGAGGTAKKRQKAPSAVSQSTSSEQATSAMHVQQPDASPSTPPLQPPPPVDEGLADQPLVLPVASLHAEALLAAATGAEDISNQIAASANLQGSSLADSSAVSALGQTAPAAAESAHPAPTEPALLPTTAAGGAEFPNEPEYVSAPMDEEEEDAVAIDDEEDLASVAAGTYDQSDDVQLMEPPAKRQALSSASSASPSLTDECGPACLRSGGLTGTGAPLDAECDRPWPYPDAVVQRTSDAQPSSTVISTDAAGVSSVDNAGWHASQERSRQGKHALTHQPYSFSNVVRWLGFLLFVDPQFSMSLAESLGTDVSAIHNMARYGKHKQLGQAVWEILMKDRNALHTLVKESDSGPSAGSTHSQSHSARVNDAAPDLEAAGPGAGDAMNVAEAVGSASASPKGTEATSLGHSAEMAARGAQPSAPDLIADAPVGSIQQEEGASSEGNAPLEPVALPEYSAMKLVALVNYLHLTADSRFSYNELSSAIDRIVSTGRMREIGKGTKVIAHGPRQSHLGHIWDALRGTGSKAVRDAIEAWKAGGCSEDLIPAKTREALLSPRPKKTVRIAEAASDSGAGAVVSEVASDALAMDDVAPPFAAPVQEDGSARAEAASPPVAGAAAGRTVLSYLSVPEEEVTTATAAHARALQLDSLGSPSRRLPASNWSRTGLETGSRAAVGKPLAYSQKRLIGFLRFLAVQGTPAASMASKCHGSLDAVQVHTLLTSSAGVAPELEAKMEVAWVYLTQAPEFIHAFQQYCSKLEQGVPACGPLTQRPSQRHDGLTSLTPLPTPTPAGGQAQAQAGFKPVHTAQVAPSYPATSFGQPFSNRQQLFAGAQAGAASGPPFVGTAGGAPRLAGYKRQLNGGSEQE